MSIFKKKKLGIVKVCMIVFIFLFLVSCKNYAVKVGDVGITYSDISYKMKVEKIYMDGDLENKYTPVVATVSLINDTMEKIVAQRYKVSATKEDLQWLDNYASNNSKRPDLLKKIRSVFKFNKSAYYRIYLEPKINNVKLRVFFVNNPDIHRDSRELIWKAYKTAHEIKDFKRIANMFGLKYVEWKLKEGDNFLYSDVFNILENMQRGELYGDILEDENSFYILKLKSKTKKGYTVECIYVEKKSFDEWFANEIKNIAVVFIDKKLEESIKSQYPAWYSQRVAKEVFK